MTDPPPEFNANVAPVEVDVSVIVVLAETVTGLFAALSTWTTIGPRVALLDAAPETGVVVITSLVATAPVTTVSDIIELHLLAAEPLLESPP